MINVVYVLVLLRKGELLAVRTFSDHRRAIEFADNPPRMLDNFDKHYIEMTELEVTKGIVE